MKFRKIIGKFLRYYYKPGCFYRIPLGPNRGKLIEFSQDVNMDMMLGIHEPNTFEVFRQLIQPGMTVVDLGANRGYFTIYMDALLNKDGNVYAFEPVPDTYVALNRCVARNHCCTVHTVPLAASNSDGTARFYLSSSHYMASLDMSWAGETTDCIEVATVRLDTFCHTTGMIPDFIKMDIEGGGVYALSGVEETIKQHQPILFLESHTPAEDRAIAQAIKWGDYDAFRVGSQQPLTNLDSDYTDPNGIWGTIIAVPRNRKGLLPFWAPNEFQKIRLGQRR